MTRVKLGIILVMVSIQAVDASPERMVDVTIETSMGNIRVELYKRDAPITVSNFLRYVEAGYFHGGRFHRTVKPDNQPSNTMRIEVIQGGAHPDRELSGHNPIRLERTSETGIRHKHGTISMARLEPDSATSDFFICIGDQPELDYGGKRNPDGQGFAAFGRVLRGMDVVRRIQRAPADGQTLTPAIEITRIKLLTDPFERLYE